MREKLRAKIRQRIHNLPYEGDENVNTLNKDNSTRTRRERDKTGPCAERVSFSSLLYNSPSTLCSCLIRPKLMFNRPKNIEVQKWLLAIIILIP